MAYQRITSPEQIAGPICIHIRSKAMIVTGDLNPNHHDELGSHQCWCNLTQHIYGPDNAVVERGRCVPGRQCYRDVR